jgi:hypothetical protein
MSDFKGRHFEAETVLWTLRWYCRYGVGYRGQDFGFSEQVWQSSLLAR